MGNDEITFGRRLSQDEKVERYANMRKKCLSTPLIFTSPRENTAINTYEILRQIQIPVPAKSHPETVFTP